MFRIGNRVRQALAITFGLGVIYYFLISTFPSTALQPEITTTSNIEPIGWIPSFQEQYVEFIESLVNLLRDDRPPVAPLLKLGVAGVVGFGDHKESALERPDLVIAGSAAIRLMREAHEDFVKQSANITLPFLPGTRGIVSTAGGLHIPIFLISLRMLRRTGSHLPVELFLASSDEHDPYLCNEVLPQLNARCVVLTDFLKPPQEGGPIFLDKYQYKIFSILFSSFEQVLFLDADNFPVKDPEYVFDAEPFKSTGLVTWPDFWVSTASTKFYSIQGTEQPPTNLRASTESGQVLVNKQTHSASLLVTTYYNIFGPTHYYPLLTQGGPGEGDKETFLAGAAAVNAPFYQVSKPVSVLGYFQEGELHGVAMLQYDPVADHDGHAKRAPFTVHANFPKMDPNTLFGAESPVINPSTGEHHRLWNGNEAECIERFGKDLERSMWEEIRHVACNLGTDLKHWKAKQSHGKQKGACKNVEDHINTVFVFPARMKGLGSS